MAAAVALGLSMDRVVLQFAAGALLVVIAIVHLSGRTPKRASTPAGHDGQVPRSFMMSTAHGAGLILAPALISLCMIDAPAREITASGSLAPALLDVAVHTVAMLAVIGVISTGVCWGLDVGGGLFQRLGKS